MIYVYSIFVTLCMSTCTSTPQRALPLLEYFKVVKFLNVTEGNIRDRVWNMDRSNGRVTAGDSSIL